MRNEWLEDFRLELYALGRAIWDFQEGVVGSSLDLYYELQRVAKQVVREFAGEKLLEYTKETLAQGCVNYMTALEAVKRPDGVIELIDGTSLVDILDLTKYDPFAYCVKHMTEYLRNC